MREQVPDDFGWKAQAVLIGGYFGTWAPIETAWDMPLDPESLKAAGLTFGCGLVRIMDSHTCGVDYSARIMDFLAAGSAMQCGPCKYGLPDLAAASGRLAGFDAKPSDLHDMGRWTALVTGRGACRHPDGAAQQMSSAMAVFADDFASHAQYRRCLAVGAVAAGARR